uniref:(northern house mosquito) hypothetical protein n=1 Tax=Culex pipiens TaxID=7175 RepID=A0A8D7ZW84_CULPI
MVYRFGEARHKFLVQRIVTGVVFDHNFLLLNPGIIRKILLMNIPRHRSLQHPDPIRRQSLCPQVQHVVAGGRRQNSHLQRTRTDLLGTSLDDQFALSLQINNDIRPIFDPLGRRFHRSPGNFVQPMGGLNPEPLPFLVIRLGILLLRPLIVLLEYPHQFLLLLVRRTFGLIEWSHRCRNGIRNRLDCKYYW